TADDVAIVNAVENLPDLCARKITFSAYSNRADFRLSEGAIVFENKPVLRLNQTKLRGSHNIENLMATLAAGHARGLAFEKMVRSTSLIGEMAERIARDWNGAGKTELANSLADAVERAHAAAKSGEVVLFSPGTSSFDMFKSYADRGDQFRALVQALPQ